MKSYTPANGWVLLQAEEVSEKSEGGIIKPQSAIDAERAIGAASAPSFKVLKTGALSFGSAEKEYEYPALGSHVYVLNVPLQILTINTKEKLIFAHVDVIAGAVTEENA